MNILNAPLSIVIFTVVVGSFASVGANAGDIRSSPPPSAVESKPVISSAVSPSLASESKFISDTGFSSVISPFVSRLIKQEGDLFRLQLRGVFQVDSNISFSLHNPRTGVAEWIVMGDVSSPIFIERYEPADHSIVVKHKDQVVHIPLYQSDGKRFEIPSAPITKADLDSSIINFTPPPPPDEIPALPEITPSKTPLSTLPGTPPGFLASIGLRDFSRQTISSPRSTRPDNVDSSPNSRKTTESDRPTTAPIGFSPKVPSENGAIVSSPTVSLGAPPAPPSFTPRMPILNKKEASKLIPVTE